MSDTPLIFLSFANDQNGQFLKALEPEKDALQSTLIDYQKKGWGNFYAAATSEPDKLLRDLNRYSGQVIIFHFSGHNEGVNLQFEDAAGNPAPFHNSRLEAFLSTEKNLKLVFLNACATAENVKALQKAGIPAIIATDKAVGDRQAQKFSKIFYDSFLTGISLEHAFDKAKGILDSETNKSYLYRGIDWGNIGEDEINFPWGLHILDEDILSWKLSDLGQKKQKRGLEFDDVEDVQKYEGQNYLLSIGINKYENFTNLNNAVLDATTIRDLLIEQYQFFDKNSITLLNEEATRGNILETLNELECKLKPEDNFLLYFAGHGLMNAKKTKGFWIPVEAEERTYQYIRNTSILEILKDFEAKHIYLLIDSCFSGSMILRSGEANEHLVESFPSRRVLTSGRKELVSDGRPGQHSPFAKCIISYLKDNMGAAISSKDLEYHVEKNVPRTASQNPEAAFLYGLGDQSGQFIFRRDRNLPPKGHKKKNENDLVEEVKELKQINQVSIFESELEQDPSLSMVYIESGNLRRGKIVNKEIRYSSTHIELSDFEIGKYLVTQEKWEEIMGYNPAEFQNNIKNLPIESVTWHELQKFLFKINELNPGKNYRLPTEAEWEFAASGGNRSKVYLYSGSNNLNEVGWNKENSKGELHPIGEKKPNELGIYDMSGNLYEWCQDWYANFPKNDFQVLSNPLGPKLGSKKVVKGGSWFVGAQGCKIFNRGQAQLSPASKYYGFRLARTIESPKRNEHKKNNFGEYLQKRPQRSTYLGPIKMIQVEGGAFQMSKNYTVELFPYEISRTPITQLQWKNIMGNNPSNFYLDKNTKNLPVENISWFDVQEFLKKLNENNPGANYALPTEAEWEFAARGGIKTKGYHYSGDNDLTQVGWFNENATDSTNVVGQKSPNELGIYDMSGNVWEWCNDWFGQYPEGINRNPYGPHNGSAKIIRGGSWENTQSKCRIDYRGRHHRESKSPSIGFRIVRRL